MPWSSSFFWGVLLWEAPGTLHSKDCICMQWPVCVVIHKANTCRSNTVHSPAYCLKGLALQGKVVCSSSPKSFLQAKLWHLQSHLKTYNVKLLVVLQSEETAHILLKFALSFSPRSHLHLRMITQSRAWSGFIVVWLVPFFCYRPSKFTASCTKETSCTAREFKKQHRSNSYGRAKNVQSKS